MKSITIPTTYIIGISTRTSNTNGQSLIDIEELWEKFWQEEISNKIPNKINNDIYAVYTDYESNFTGKYTTIIGLSVSSLDDISKDMVGLTIETTIYNKIISNGKMPEAIANTWLKIWADDEIESKRAYKADFTIHGEKYYDGNNAQVETYLSVKSSI